MPQTVVLAIAAALIVAVVGADITLRRRTISAGVLSWLLVKMQIWRVRRRHAADHVRNCQGYSGRHPRFRPRDTPALRACSDCGKPTCGRRMRVNPQTLRRQMTPVCYADSLEEDGFRDVRRRLDWERITTPPEASRIVGAAMPDQYAGPVRDTIRAFMASDAVEVAVDGIAPSSLNQSLRTVGLHERAFAEQRDGKTILRKVEAFA